jgi:hypothetical protein
MYRGVPQVIGCLLCKCKPGFQKNIQKQNLSKNRWNIDKGKKKCFISILVALGFEVRASCLLVKHSTA